MKITQLQEPIIRVPRVGFVQNFERGLPSIGTTEVAGLGSICSVRGEENKFGASPTVTNCHLIHWRVRG
jgi:hypothetical protein